MPSSNKTPHLELNRWLGSDKPKKDDFNGDNDRVDAACKSLSQRITSLEEAGGGGELEELLEQHTGNADAHFTGVEKAQLPGLLAHLANAAVHVTEEEKAAWSSGGGGGGGGPVIRTYVGDGYPSRTLPLDFSPSLGFLFAVGRGATEADWSGNEFLVFCGFFSVSGSSRYISITQQGLAINHNATRPGTGCSYKYNEQDVTYVYVMWP